MCAVMLHGQKEINMSYGAAGVEWMAVVVRKESRSSYIMYGVHAVDIFIAVG